MSTQSSQIEVGTKFRIKGNVYKNRTFTVVEVSEDEYSIKCENDLGDTQFFSQTNLNYYGDNVQIVAQPRFEKGLMKTAVAQTLASFIALADGEADGSTKLAAVIKAADVIDANDSIKFDGVKLEFISSFSKQKRIVTKDGCADCPCKNKMSYHKALFAILTRYQELQTETKVRIFRPKTRRQVERLAA